MLECNICFVDDDVCANQSYCGAMKCQQTPGGAYCYCEKAGYKPNNDLKRCVGKVTSLMSSGRNKLLTT